MYADAGNQEITGDSIVFCIYHGDVSEVIAEPFSRVINISAVDLIACS